MRTAQMVYWLTALAFLAHSGAASADWSRLGGDKDAVFYVDPETVTQNSGLASVWILKDFKQEQTGPSREKFRSAKVYYEFKCDEKLVRQAYLTRHFGSMGGAGSLSSDASFHAWAPVDAGSEGAKLFEMACKPRVPRSSVKLIQ